MSFLATLGTILELAASATSTAVGISSLFSGARANKDIEEINKEALEIARYNNRIQQKQQAIVNALKLRELGLTERIYNFNMQEAIKNREEKAEERLYNRLQNAANKISDFINWKMSTQNVRLSPIINRGLR